LDPFAQCPPGQGVQSFAPNNHGGGLVHCGGDTYYNWQEPIPDRDSLPEYVRPLAADLEFNSGNVELRTGGKFKLIVSNRESCSVGNWFMDFNGDRQADVSSSDCMTGIGSLAGPWAADGTLRVSRTLDASMKFCRTEDGEADIRVFQDSVCGKPWPERLWLEPDSLRALTEGYCINARLERRSVTTYIMGYRKGSGTLQPC